MLIAVTGLVWSLIDPTIFGALFERFLDPDKRAQMGAHYTDTEKIMMIVEPVSPRPLRREWETSEGGDQNDRRPTNMPEESAGRGGRRARGRSIRRRRARRRSAARRVDRSALAVAHPRPRLRLGQLPSLRPADVKDIEYRAILECESLGLDFVFAARRAGNFSRHRDQPVCRRARAHHDLDRRHPVARAERDPHHPRLDHAEAQLDRMPRRAAHADGKAVRRGGVAGGGFYYRQPAVSGGQADFRGLGEDYVETLLRGLSRTACPAEADLVCYWFSKGWKAIEGGRAEPGRLLLRLTRSRRQEPEGLSSLIAQACEILKAVERRTLDR